MRKSTKILMIVAVSLIAAGLIAFCVAMTAVKWNFLNLMEEKYDMKEYEITESFHGISIMSDTADITFVPTDGTQTKVSCREKTRLTYSVTVEDGALAIHAVDARKWYDHIQLFGSGTQKITVYLPRGEYGALNIKESTGDVTIPSDYRFASVNVTLSTGDVACEASASDSVRIKANTGDVKISGVSAGSLSISTITGEITASSVTVTGEVTVHVSTGKSRLSDLRCKTLVSKGDAGDLTMNRVIADESFSLKRITGDVTLEECDAAQMEITTNTGDVKGTLLSEKIFLHQSNTGKVSLPESTRGGVCRITTTTGDICFSVKNDS